MINFARIGACCFAVLLMSVPAFCQNESVKSVSNRLVEVRTDIDKEYANIAAYQQHMNNATEAKDKARVEKLREEIDYTWKEIERLKELEDMLKELREKEIAEQNRKPRVAVGGVGGFNSDSSTGSKGVREFGAIMEDGSAGNQFGVDSSTGGEGPKVAFPNPENENEVGGRDSSSARPPQQRPQIAIGGGAVSEDFAGGKTRAEPPPENSLTSRKLEQLESSWQSLIDAGEQDLADRVQQSIRVEKRRLADEQRKIEREEARNRPRPNSRPPQTGRSSGRNGGGLTSTEPEQTAPGVKSKSREELIAELEELIRQLQDENKALRGKDGGDK